MKYLIITNHSYMLWQFRKELIERLLQQGEVIISTPFVGHESDFEKLGCKCIDTKIERRGTNPFHDLALIRDYRRILKTEIPDRVITFSIKPNLYAGFLCQRMEIPYYANVQGLGTAFQSRKMAAFVSVLYRAALKKAKTVFFENETNANIFVERKIIPKDRITLLHGAGVNLEQYPYREYPSEENGIRFLYLGRIMREKGIDELFKVMRRIKEEFCEKVWFDLVGFFEDDYKKTVEDLCRDGIIDFHGFQDDPKPWYAAAHCIVMPSWHEGMSNVLLEAASTGRALITSDVPGCREAVINEKTGFLFTVQDADSLYNKIKDFLTLSTEERVLMGKNGREKMELEFDRECVIDTVIRSL